METLKRFGPVLVLKSKVKSMIQFLVGNNEWYQAGGVRYSEEKMNTLLWYPDAGSDMGILQCMQMEHAGDTSSSEDGAYEWVKIQNDIVMDNIAYTLGDHSPRSRESMKAHALDRRRFLNSQAGTNYVADNHPGFLSYLFPHLDPWGIGGFNHPGHPVKCLLHQYQSPFARDPFFAFICWNIIQKQTVSRQALFTIKDSSHQMFAHELATLGPSLTDIANKWSRDPHAKASSDSEKRTVGVLRNLQIASKNLKGSAGYKLSRQNEIHSVIRRYSTPALFVTLNPHNLSSVLLGALGGVPEDDWC
ncbi:hypothetical protein L210DRAFT_3611229 [Boletus edulis BED1]|uniref:Helitron helicase-like domain-containing protein n=1 Tax=Boletus edulis BED1 TaxID=1328754 RepID=A0AAD4BYQ7_BOLED|nr:hypothetical protein L210DRAFT_3611229 [Boletus edulis BED1]